MSQREDGRREGRLEVIGGLIITILITVGVFAIAFLMLFLVSLAAHAHIHDRPDLDNWVNGLTNKQGGQCCDNTEARRVEDPDYEGLPDGSGGYRVKIDGAWLVVPESRVIQEPNRYGPALAWPYKNMGGITEIRCFLPGSGA